MMFMPGFCERVDPVRTDAGTQAKGEVGSAEAMNGAMQTPLHGLRRIPWGYHMNATPIARRITPSTMSSTTLDTTTTCSTGQKAQIRGGPIDRQD